jgi:replication factor C subunit 3/5
MSEQNDQSNQDRDQDSSSPSSQKADNPPSNLPWIEKYRPADLSEVISHDSKIEVLKKLIDGRQLPHLLFWGSPGSGKCLGKGTLVRLWSGDLKRVEDLKAGEELMGDDLTKRTILSTCSGTDKLYRITQSHGMTYVVNEPHILTQWHINKGPTDIALLDYSALKASELSKYQGFRLNMNNILDHQVYRDDDSGKIDLEKMYTYSKINIEYMGEGEYYGFELDGNGRFLLEDSTVTHNTSSILALARQMYGPNYKRYILELNASDDRGIDIVRNKIPIFAKTKSDDMRLVILDEADAMTVDAQSALRRVMELYIKNCRFCLICNNINKIIPAIQSRCAKMRFGVLDPNSIRKKLLEIIEKENIKVDSGAIDQLLEIHQDFRQILNTLQCLKSIRFGETITETDVIEYLGMANGKLIREIIETINTQPFKRVYNYLVDLHRDNRIDITNLIGNLVNYTINRDDIDEVTRSKIIDGLASVEYRMITGSDTEIQLASLIGHMMIGRKQ